MIADPSAFATVTASSIWDLVSSRQSVEPLVAYAPDEFRSWARDIVSELNARFSEIERVALAVLSDTDRSWSRDAQEAHIRTAPYPEIVLAMLDGHRYADQIWSMIRPINATPFADAN